MQEQALQMAMLMQATTQAREKLDGQLDRREIDRTRSKRLYIGQGESLMDFNGIHLTQL